MVMTANYPVNRKTVLVCKLDPVKNCYRKKKCYRTKGFWGDGLMAHGLAYPEGTVGDTDTSPRNHGCVLHWLSGHIRAAVSAIAIVLDCCLHRAALIVL